MRNTYFSHGTQAEKNLYEDLIIEQLKIYGQDTYYLPREEITRDSVLGNTTDKFTDAYAIEMYVEDVNGFAGQGDLIGKFGLEVRDELTFVVSRRTFEILVDNSSNTLSINRPREGDIIWMPLFKKFWQIDFVEDEDPMYQINDLPIFKLKCSMWEYQSESVVGDVEAVLTEAGEFLIDETDGDNILYEDDPEYVEYILLEDAATENMNEDPIGGDNAAFDTAAGLDDFDSNNDIFDFTEKNPFGDPRDN